MPGKVIKERQVTEEPKTVKEQREVEVPKTVMEKRTVEEEKTVTEARVHERLAAASCSVIAGSDVYNSQGDKLGTIDDLMIDLYQKRIAYAILKSGSFLGMGGKLLPVPMEALKVEGTDTEQPSFVLDVSKERLDQARGYSADELPRQVDYSWLGTMYSQYGYQPYWRE